MFLSLKLLLKTHRLAQIVQPVKTVFAAYLNGIALGFPALRLFLAQMLQMRVVESHQLYHRHTQPPQVIVNTHRRKRLDEINHVADFTHSVYHFCSFVFVLILFFFVTACLNTSSISRLCKKKLMSRRLKVSIRILPNCFGSQSHISVL